MSRQTIVTWIFAALLSWSAGRLPAQQVWNAPSGANLDVFLAQVAPGDVVYLSGSYAPFTLLVGVTLIGPARVEPGTAVPHNSTHQSAIAVPAGQHAHLVDLVFANGGTFGSGVTQEVDVAGDVDFESCDFLCAGYWTALRIHAGAVCMHHCFVAGMMTQLQGGTLAISDCVLRGFDATSAPTISSSPSRPALLQTGGVLLAAFADATGGRGALDFHSWLPLAPSPAFSCQGGAAFVSDSVLLGGSGLAYLLSVPGAPALEGLASTSVARCLLTGGPGSLTGPPSTGTVAAVPHLLGLRVDHGLEVGRVTTVSVTAGTGQPMVLVAGVRPGVTSLPPLTEPVFGQPGLQVPLAFALPQPPAVTAFAMAVPNVQTLLGIGLRVQALQLDGVGARASAAIGSVIR